MVNKNNIFLYKQNISLKNLYFKIKNKAPVYEERLNNTLHWHDYFEAEFVYSGRGKHIVNNTSYELKRGSAYLLTPLDIHTVISDINDELCLYSINFNEYALSEELLNTVLSAPKMLKTEFDESEILYLIDELERLQCESNTGLLYREAMLRSSFERICIMLLRNVTAQSEQGSMSSVTDTVIQKAVSYIKFNFRSNISLTKLSEKLAITPNYLGEIFKKNMSVSFHEYLNNLRIDYAMNLLRNSTLNINEIAVESGFNSPSYFIEIFKHRTGKTPAQYRKQVPVYSNLNE